MKLFFKIVATVVLLYLYLLSASYLLAVMDYANDLAILLGFVGIITTAAISLFLLGAIWRKNQ